ncbi:hypothetical protein, partial [Pseudomonas syringae]|uniref:hypothetical protein n=1 Tax=Pseudomonas syringae TaxID=317 RepID=UPI001F393DCC
RCWRVPFLSVIRGVLSTEAGHFAHYRKRCIPRYVPLIFLLFKNKRIKISGRGFRLIFSQESRNSAQVYAHVRKPVLICWRA